jgi:cytochrome c
VKSLMDLAIVRGLERAVPFFATAEPDAGRRDAGQDRIRRHGERRLLTGLVASAALILMAGTASAGPGNVQAGKHDFGRCGACHSIQRGVNRFGPSLHCIVGRRAATAPNYHYSNSLQALGAKGVRWNKANLFDYLNNPRVYLEKKLGKSSIHNKMTMKFHGKTFRRDVIAYLAAHACD